MKQEEKCSNKIGWNMQRHAKNVVSEKLLSKKLRQMQKQKR